MKVLISELFFFVSQPTHPQQLSPVAQARDFHEGTTDEHRRQTDSMQVQHVDKIKQPQLSSLMISSTNTAFLAVLRSCRIRFNSKGDTPTLTRAVRNVHSETTPILITPSHPWTQISNSARRSSKLHY